MSYSYIFDLLCMEERRYISNKFYLEWRSCALEFIRLLCILSIFIGFVIGFLLVIDYMNNPTYSYAYFIRHSTNIIRINCLTSYFKKFPFPKPNIGYEYIENPVPPSIYTLSEIEKELNIQIYFKSEFDIGNIIYDFNNDKVAVIAWDHTNIPKLATLLGCEKCESWNINPISNITDDSLYDITWVLRHIKYKKSGIITDKNNMLEFYSVSQNLEDSIISNNICEYISDYMITKW